MSYFTVNVSKSGDTGTLEPDVGLHYSDNLNELNEAEIKFSGTGKIRRELLSIGANVEIKRNGTREFYGILDNIDYLNGGAVSAHISGFEKWLALENGDYSNSPYISAASATIASEIIAESNYLTAGTIETGFNTDFRISKSESLYNALSNLTRKTQQDIGIDYANLEVNILNHKGSSTSVATFNDGLNIKNLRVTFGYPLGNYILVYGKGDGENQIKAESKDDDSIYLYGRIKRPVIDKSIMSPEEAQKLADAELALTKDPVKIYDFEIINLGENLVSGDHILLNSPDKDLENEEVRIVGIERGLRNGTEYLSIQVTNPAFKTLMRTRNKILAGLKKESRDTNSYMNGQRIVTPINGSEICDSTNPLNLRIYIPTYISDEAGNNRIKSIKLDYSLRNYKKITGSSSVSAVQSLNMTSTVASTTDNKSSTVASQTDDKSNYYTEVTDFTGIVNKAYIDEHNHNTASETSGSSVLIDTEGTDDQTETINTSSWDNICSEYIANASHALSWVSVKITNDGWTGTDTISIRIRGLGFFQFVQTGINFNSSFDFENTFVVPFMVYTSGTVYVDMMSSGGKSYKCETEVFTDIEHHTHSIPSQTGGSSTGAINREVYLQNNSGGNFTIAESSTTQSNNSLVYDTDNTVADRVYEVVDNTSDRASSSSDGNVINATILDLTEITTSATGVKVYIDGTNKTTEIFGSDPHNETEDENIDITDYCNTAGWHIIQIYPQGDTAFTIAEIRLDFVLDS